MNYKQLHFKSPRNSLPQATAESPYKGNSQTLDAVPYNLSQEAESACGKRLRIHEGDAGAYIRGVLQEPVRAPHLGYWVYSLDPRPHSHVQSPRRSLKGIAFMEQLSVKLYHTFD